MFSPIPLPFSLLYFEGLENPTDAEALRAALWIAEDGQPMGFEPLGGETLADALPARFETLSAWTNGQDALVVAEDASRALTAWDGQADDPFEALDEALPTERLTVVHLDPAAGAYGLLLADDGLLQRRLYVSDQQRLAWISTGRLDAQEIALWDSADLPRPETAEDLLSSLADAQDELGNLLQFVLTSLAARRLEPTQGLDLFSANGTLWDESVASFCLDDGMA